MLDRLINLVSQLGYWGYLVVFLAVTLESAAFLGFVVPGETLVLVGGFLAAQGLLDWGDLMVFVCTGAILGDTIGYEVGRHLGQERLLRAGRWIGLRQEHLEKVEAFFHRHGGKTVFLGRFTALLRALTPFVAGASGMPYPRFLLYNAAGGIVWGIAFVLIGYCVGASWRVVGHWIGQAAAVVGGLLMLVLVLGWLWRWLVRHEEGIRRWWERCLQRPRVAAFRQRFALQLAFLQARLTPGGYLGLSLTVGIVVCIAAVWLFGGIAQDVIAGDPLTVVDVQVAQWLHEHATPALTDLMRCITRLGSGPVITAIAVVVALRWAWRRQWYRLLDLVLVVPGGALLNVLLTHIFHRPRPTFAHPLVHLSSASFPSGQTVAAALLYGLLACFAVQSIPQWRWRILSVLAAFLLVVLVGFSRLYLGAHYLSDVLAAAVEGVAWLAMCLTALETLRRSREHLSPPHPE